MDFIYRVCFFSDEGSLIKTKQSSSLSKAIWYTKDEPDMVVKVYGGYMDARGKFIQDSLVHVREFGEDVVVT